MRVMQQADMNETNWHEILKLSCKIQLFKNSRWKSTLLTTQNRIEKVLSVDVGII